MKLSHQTHEAIVKLQAKYPSKRSALIPALHLAQQACGYLSEEVQQEVADLFNISANEVHAVVSFYEMFHTQPVGKHLIHVCKNVSCMLRGGEALLETICQKLNTRPGERTEDGEFTVIASECLAACDKAPMCLVDDTVVGPVNLEEVDDLIAQAKLGKGHPSPVEHSDA